jgi:hypothetical protein
LEEQYLSSGTIEEDKAAAMVANMNQILQQEIDRLSDENARMDVKLAYAAELVADSDEEEAETGDDTPDMFAAAGVMELLPEEEEADAAEAAAEETTEAEAEEEVRTEEITEAEAEEDDWGTEPELPETGMDEAAIEDHWENVPEEQIPQETQRLPEVVMSEDIAEDIIRQATAQQTKKIGELPQIDEPEDESVTQRTIKSLSGEQREIFTYFVSIKGMEQQICQAMTGVVNHLLQSTSSATGNMVIQGNQGSGKTMLATSIIKAVQNEIGKPNGKIGKIEASSLNKRDVADILKKVQGGCLIIEKAGDISRETAVKMGLLLASDNSGVFVVLEDTHKGIEKALGKDDGFAARFSEKINIPVFTSDELVIFAKSYANELGYTIDEMGVLALYNSISNIQKLDHPTTLIEVKDIVDHAIEKAEKGGLKKALSILTSRRYDADDYVILYEKDFGF